ncbi:MAG: ScnB-like protein [Litoreibacter sp.]
MDIMDDFRGMHDLGGLIELPLDQSEHDYAPWEKRVHAIRELLAQKGLLRVDELRRAVESIGEEKYIRLSYYEQWVWAMSQVMIERGIMTDFEFAQGVAKASADHDA